MPESCGVLDCSKASIGFTEVVHFTALYRGVKATERLLIRVCEEHAAVLRERAAS